MEPLASTDIVSSHARVYEPVVPDSGTASRTGEHATQHVSIPQNVSAAAAQCRPLVKGSHTLRERRMTYLRNMYAMLDQPEPDVPRAILRATSAVRRTKWEIEAGVVGKHPRRKQPAFVAQYRGSSDALLHRQRQLIFEEVHKKRGGSLRSLLNYKHPEVPQSVGEEPSNWNNVHRMEVEEMMRGANLDASDLDEADMDGVVSAVMSAATEAARLATASF
ncbi:hypothetical protein C8T65DRAFT_182439 [Cerioporus squamosus]|nr:hypothetical protein C8T65DRAFT_182439 [Cerioporus squamosus]